MNDADLKKIIDTAKEQGHRIVTAESLTGGGICAALTRISGASAVVNGGFGVYQDEMKASLLDVPVELLQEFTAVSAQVANAMAKGALEKTGIFHLANPSDIAIAVTGYASDPGDLAPASDTGLVYIGIGTDFNSAANPEIKVYEHRFEGDRDAVRQQTTDTALGYVQQILGIQ